MSAFYVFLACMEIGIPMCVGVPRLFDDFPKCYVLKAVIEAFLKHPAQIPGKRARDLCQNTGL